MKSNTADAGKSRPPSDPMHPDLVAKRDSTVAKAIERLNEIAEKLVLIDKALGSILPEYIAHHPMGTAVDNFHVLAKSVEAVEEGLKGVRGRIAYSKEVSFPERMDAEEVKTFNTDDRRITRTASLYASIITEQQEAAYAWLRQPDPNDPEKDYSSIIKETVNSSSLSALAKELINNGFELPEELFRVYTKDSISITAKKK